MSTDEAVCLETVPWTVLTVDTTQYLVKAVIGEESYDVILCDLCTMWRETLSGPHIIQRSKTLNANIEAPLRVLLNTLKHNISDDKSTSYNVSTSSDQQQVLALNTALASLPFHWEFILTPTQGMNVQLVNPLLSMVRELNHRMEALVKQLIAKDREIQDYKEHGALISRKYLETAPFVEEVFVSEMSANSKARVTNCLSFLSQPSAQCLYTELTRARLEADTTDEPPVSTDDPVAVTSPLTSPTKKPSPTLSKEDEVARRKELERKLEAETQKPKKKKRKLM